MTTPHLKPSAAAVLRVLCEKGRAGATTSELCQPNVGGVRFSARIKEMRDLGYVIENLRERPGSERYWIHAEPRDVVQTPSGAERGEQQAATLFEFPPASPGSAVMQDWDDAA